MVKLSGRSGLGPRGLATGYASSFKLEQKVRAVKAAGQHATSESNVLSPRISAPAIPWKSVALYATIAAGFFLLGFLPMWFKVTQAVEQRDAAQRGMRLAQLRNTLATAVIHVQQKEYEPARQLTSEFYTNLRRQIDSDRGALFTVVQRQGLSSLLGERDQLITLLARSDPAAKDRLVTVYSTYNKLANNGG